MLQGKLSLHPRGFGFVAFANHEDVFIPAKHLKGAMDGDIVSVSITGRSPKGFEGKIHTVVKRGRRVFVGLITSVGKNGDGVATSLTTGENQTILVQKPPKHPLHIGDRVALQIVKTKSDSILCKCVKIFGSIENPSIDTEVALVEHQLKETFPEAVVREAQSLSLNTKDRVDLTTLTTLTIDPVNARDYDDALSIKKDKKGHYHLGVHIADVSAFVKPGSALDKEAYKRSNSTYFPDRVVPMLPHELSSDLCSLKEGVERLTASALMEFDVKGTLLNYKLVRSVILSRKRFTYEEAKEVLDGKQKSPYLNDLNLLVELALLLKRQRKERGSVELSMPEIRLILDDKGMPTGYTRIEYDITHQMVEEFMLKANELVATHLIQQGKKSLFRIHEEPNAETIEEFFSYARLLGFPLPAAPKETDIALLFEQAQKSPLLEQLAIRFIRSMKLAIYSPENIGHYGLALENYTHFTSPIRRYSDLVIHRLLFEPKYKPNLKELSTHCTEQERKSFKAEMGVIKLKKLRFLDALPEKVYNVTITNIKPNGIYFDIDFIGFEGFIHVSELGREYFHYHPERRTFTGEQTNTSYHIGKSIRVRLTQLSLLTQSCTWAIL